MSTIKTDGARNARYEALIQAQAKATEVEKEVMAKKKLETYQVAEAKLTALQYQTRTILRLSPELIGCSVLGTLSLADRRTMMWDVFLVEHMPLINRMITDQGEFRNAIMAKKRDEAAWNAFTDEFKLIRMLRPNEFDPVWTFILDSLQAEHLALPLTDDCDMNIDVAEPPASPVPSLFM